MRRMRQGIILFAFRTILQSVISHAQGFIAILTVKKEMRTAAKFAESSFARPFGGPDGPSQHYQLLILN